MPGPGTMPLSSGNRPPAPNPQRDAIREKLNSLVSPGTARLYKDACDAMDKNPPFAAITHIAGHLIREVESSLRSVLRPLIEEEIKLCEECGEAVSDEKCICGRPKGLMSHKQSIEEALTSLGLEVDDPLIKAWKDISGKGNKFAHRIGLEEPRPMNNDFREYWQGMEDVFIGVLKGFENKYSKVFDRLDSLIAKPNPDRGDAKTLRSNFPNNQTTREYFYNRLENPEWLIPLRQEKEFKYPPNSVYFDDGRVQSPAWPQLIYLRRMAEIDSKEVSEILLEMDDTDNQFVMGNLVEIAGLLTQEHFDLLLPKIEKWI